MEDEELVKMFNPTEKETYYFIFLIVMINGLTWIVSDIGLDTCARGRRMYYSVSLCGISIIIMFCTNIFFFSFF